MQTKRKAQEAFLDSVPKPRLSAFAAAKAKAASRNGASPTGDGNIAIDIVKNNTQNGAVVDITALPALLSSFPLAKSQELNSASSDDELTGEAGNFSDDEGNYARANVSLHKASQPTKLSTLALGKHNALSYQKDRLTLKMEADEMVTFIGEYDLQVVTGIVMIYGAILRPSSKSYRVYAPSTHALPSITAKSAKVEICIISTGLSLGGLSRVSPLWLRLWPSPSKDCAIREGAADRSFALLRSSLDDPLKRALSPLDLEQDIQITLNRILRNPTSTHPSSVIMVSGPKGSGKSTISKWLINTFLTASKAVASTTCFWLDLDPGQPEFSAPGLISLVQVREPVLGPNYTHPSGHVGTAHRLIRSHTLASNSPKEDVGHFLACAANLRDEYFRMLEDFPGAPLILNCSGWVLGSAVSVMMDLVQQFPLTDVVLMQPMEPDTVSAIEATLPMAKVLTIPPRAKPAQSRTSAELRAMQTMSYFHALPPKNGLSLWTNQGLSELQPWHVRYNGENAGISSIISYGEAVNPDFLAAVIDGMVLVISVVESDEAYATQQYRPAHVPEASAVEMGENMNERIGRTPEGLPYLRADNSGLIQPLNPRFSSSVGLALVRGIDVRKQELQLLTPLSSNELRRLEGSKTVLIRGRLDSPDWAFLEDVYSGFGGVDSTGNISRPYVAKRGAETGLGGNVWRVRHLPRKFGGDVGV